MALSKDELLGSLSRYLASRGEFNTLTILCASNIDVEYNEDCNSNTCGAVYLSTPLFLYDQLKFNTQHCAQVLLDTLREIPKSDIVSAHINPETIDDPDWREKSSKYLSGYINNADISFDEELLPVKHQNIIFRNMYSLNAHHALKEMNITFSSLPLLVLNEKSIRPDFIIYKNDKSIVLSVGKVIPP